MKNKPPQTLIANGAKSMRQFKAIKRIQLRNLAMALGEYRTGCASCPGYPDDISELDKIIVRMTHSHSEKEWGR